MSDEPVQKKGPKRRMRASKTAGYKRPSVKKSDTMGPPKVMQNLNPDRRVVWFEFLDAEPSFLTFGDGTVRVYRSSSFDDLDPRLVLGMTPGDYADRMPLIDSPERYKQFEYKAIADKQYQGTEHLMLLSVAQKLFPRYRYSDPL